MEPELKEEVVAQKGTRVMAILAIILLLVITAGVVSVWVRLSPSKAPIVEKPIETKSKFVEPTDSTPEFFEGNFTYSLQPVMGWERISSASTSLPEGISEAYFGFRRGDKACSIVYGRINGSEFYDTYKQISFGERIVTTEHQFDPSWYAPSSSLPAGFVFAGRTRTVLPGEVLPAQYDVERINKPGVEIAANDGFILFNEDGKAVSDPSCANSFYDLIQSTVITYHQVSLTSESDGLLYVGMKPRMNGNIEAHVMFATSSDAFPKELLPIELSPDQMPTGYRGKLYIADKNTVSEVDFLQKKVTPIAGLNIPATEVVNDFYFYNGSLFALVGPSCTDYRGLCDNRLIEKKLGDASPVVELGKHIRARDFVGFDAQSRKLYMVYVDGDAGFIGGKEYVYGVDSGVVEEGRNISTTAETPEEIGGGYAIINQFPLQNRRTEVFIVTDGKITGNSDDSVSLTFPARLIVD
jgi:hypothetical protein